MTNDILVGLLLELQVFSYLRKRSEKEISIEDVLRILNEPEDQEVMSDAT